MTNEAPMTNDEACDAPCIRASFFSRHSAIRIRQPRGFTLIEIIIALTIVAVLAAAAVPMLKGFQDERVAREPVAKLVQMARGVRMRAMTEKRPYQVAFHSRGFTASPRIGTAGEYVFERAFVEK